MPENSPFKPPSVPYYDNDEEAPEGAAPMHVPFGGKGEMYDRPNYTEDTGMLHGLLSSAHPSEGWPDTALRHGQEAMGLMASIPGIGRVTPFIKQFMTRHPQGSLSLPVPTKGPGAAAANRLDMEAAQRARQMRGDEPYEGMPTKADGGKTDKVDEASVTGRESESDVPEGDRAAEVLSHMGHAFGAGLIDPAGVPSSLLNKYHPTPGSDWYKRRMQEARDENPTMAGAGSAVVPAFLFGTGAGMRAMAKYPGYVDWPMIMRDTGRLMGPAIGMGAALGNFRNELSPTEPKQKPQAEYPREGHQAGGGTQKAAKEGMVEDWADRNFGERGWDYQNLPRPTKPSPFADRENEPRDRVYDPGDVRAGIERNSKGPVYEYEGPQDQQFNETMEGIGRNYDVQNRSPTPYGRGGLVRMLLLQYYTPHHPDDSRNLGHGQTEHPSDDS